MKTEKIYTQHEENKEWMNNLLFCKDELRIMQSRIQEIASKYTSKDVLVQVEHFQNQIIVQKNNLDTLEHEINLSSDAITTELKENEKAADLRTMEDHASTRGRMEGFMKIFSELRTELNQFLSKTM